MNKEVIKSIKPFFSELHSKIDKLFYNLDNNIDNIDNIDNNLDKKNTHLDYSNLSLIMKLNRDLLEVGFLIDQINNNMIKKKQNLNKKDINQIEEYCKDEKIIKTFLPYMMYYRMCMDN